MVNHEYLAQKLLTHFINDPQYMHLLALFYALLLKKVLSNFCFRWIADARGCKLIRVS